MHVEPGPAGMAQERAPASPIALILRACAGTVVIAALVFLLNNHLIFWLDWPGAWRLLGELQWFGLQPSADTLQGGALALAWLQLASYFGGAVLIVAYVLATPHRPAHADADLLSAFAAYIVRAAFWAVFLVGLADMLISFLRVEGFLAALVGEELNAELGRPQFRGTWVHYPLILASLLIALVVRTLGFIWLAALVVFAEFQIVISRFVYSYEQAFMGDLVRFWYAALFLFASAYALIEEGHVRVDVFYARFGERGQAWANAIGSVVLGLPLCWVILTTGMWGRGSSINSPLLSFEISQSGYGLYTKYMMAGFLVVFALSMIVQFASYFLSSAAELRGEAKHRMPVHDKGL